MGMSGAHSLKHPADVMVFWSIVCRSRWGTVTRALKWFNVFLIALLGINIFVCQYGIVNILAICRPGNGTVIFEKVIPCKWGNRVATFRDNFNHASLRGKPFATTKKSQIHFVSTTNCSLCFHKVEEETNIFFSKNRAFSAWKDQTLFAYLDTQISFFFCQLLSVSAVRKRDDVEPFPILCGRRWRRLHHLPRQIANAFACELLFTS